MATHVIRMRYGRVIATTQGLRRAWEAGLTEALNERDASAGERG